MLYTPDSLLNTFVTTPVALLDAVTVTPGNTAPVASSMVPLIVAYVAGVNACVDRTTHRNRPKATRSFRMGSPFGGQSGGFYCFAKCAGSVFRALQLSKGVD